MPNKYNPFRPTSPVYSGMFAGRERELNRIDRMLYQAKFGNPTHILLLGERGIGKTSLLLVADYFAKGELDWDKQKHNFVSVKINIEENIDLISLAMKIKTHIEKELEKTNKNLTHIKKIWNFFQNFELTTPIGKFRPREKSIDERQILDALIFSISSTIRALTTDNALTELGLTQKKDGLVILIDEADKAEKELKIGSFLKYLTEKLIEENTYNLLIILGGLPITRNILRESHESSLRLFEEFNLSTLTKEEAIQVIKNGVNESNQKTQGQHITVSEEALERIYVYSEGYPHFIQQVGYSAFDINSDDIISVSDVTEGFFMKHGALDLIGDRYYKDLYYNQINVDHYRIILKIMAEKWNQWVSRQEITRKFTGKTTLLDNGLRALRERNIILQKEGSRGSYRLQWMSFAFWIKNYTKELSKK